MILFEWGYMFIKHLLRFCIWFITARDCEHCRYGWYSWSDYGCNRGYECKEKCLTTVTRCHFEREKKRGAE
jgi:hypothetical protein